MVKLTQRKRMWVGLSIGIIGIVGFFILGIQLKFFGSEIDYLSPTQHIPILSVLLGFYGFGFIGSNKQGLSLAGVWAGLLFVGWLSGYILNVV